MQKKKKLPKKEPTVSETNYVSPEVRENTEQIKKQKLKRIKDDLTHCPARNGWSHGSHGGVMRYCHYFLLSPPIVLKALVDKKL